MRRRHHSLLSSEDKDLKGYLSDLHEYTTLETLGKGSCGTVYKCQHNSNGWIVAIKELNSHELDESKQKARIQEVHILAACQDLFLLDLVGFSIKPYAIITPYMPCGNLWDLIHTRKENLNSVQKTNIAIGIAHAMKYLHSQKILHRDLKSPNILLDERILPKISDFGLSQFESSLNRQEFTTTANTNHTNNNINFNQNNRYPNQSIPSPPNNLQNTVGTPMWMAPELFDANLHSTASDVYAYGIILYELLTGRPPFEGLNDIQISFHVSRGERPPLPDPMSPISRLIAECWSQAPSMRPTFDEIYRRFEAHEVFFPHCERAGVDDLLNLIRKHDLRKISGIHESSNLVNQIIQIRNNNLSPTSSHNIQPSMNSFSNGMAFSNGMNQNMNSMNQNVNNMNQNMNNMNPNVNGMNQIMNSMNQNMNSMNHNINVMNHNKNDYLQGLLNHYSSNGNIHELGILIVSMPNIDINGKCGGIAPIHAAVISDQLIAVQFLTKLQNIDVNVLDNEGNTPFLLSVKLNKPRITAFLAQFRKVAINAQNVFGFSVLHLMMRLPFEAQNIMVKALAFARDLRVDLLDNAGNDAFGMNLSRKEEFLKRQALYRK
ncbi:hypothetical protein TRFO_06797 [Tritrichomonas foetus]|uniref:Protein kinase domain-containing protein n=1 Tax=Tritrichomonas foetus TaxID=1144522 RepID=A0A1J4JVI3_9EUKA|nr:hypothetical protein TRFO_06797 [Tritrichomonas foetus]|eukprot:OHT03137.1 hypothetical protein TRFO_06797 [Tritrichomonas foetus]